MLIYPIAWLVVTLYCIAIAVFTVLFGLAVFALSRVRVLRP